MKYNPLGATGILVSQLCLGTMTFGAGLGRWNVMGSVDQDTADAMVGKAIGAGINFFDTANVYHDGRSEETLGQAFENLGIKRSDVVIATKVFGKMGDGPNDRGNTRSHILNQVVESLRRLRTDYIDLYQLHGFDGLTPIEESLGALDECVRRGYVRYTGVSNWPAFRIQKALGISASKNISRFQSLQAYYSLAGRDIEREIVPLLGEENVGLMVWSPLAGGLLSGKYQPDDGSTPTEGRRKALSFPPVDEERGSRCIAILRDMAPRYSASVAQLALAWLLAQRHVTSVIIGARRLEQFDENLAAAPITLSEADRAILDDASQLPSEYPGWMTQFQGADRSPPKR
jgi:aryl-alcohol dehydrogenase-like predicted oxidoreductase